MVFILTAAILNRKEKKKNNPERYSLAIQRCLSLLASGDFPSDPQGVPCYPTILLGISGDRDCSECWSKNLKDLRAQLPRTSFVSFSMLNLKAPNPLKITCIIHDQCPGCKETQGGNHSSSLEQLPIILKTPHPLLYPGGLSTFPLLYFSSTETLIFL